MENLESKILFADLLRSLKNSNYNLKSKVIVKPIHCSIYFKFKNSSDIKVSCVFNHHAFLTGADYLLFFFIFVVLLSFCVFLIELLLYFSFLQFFFFKEQ